MTAPKMPRGAARSIAIRLVGQREPIFGGYGLVAAVVAWLVGITLRSLTALAALDAGLWVALGVVAALAWIGAWGAGRRLLGPRAAKVVRALLVAGMLICWSALGAARAAFADATSDPRAVVHLLPDNANAALRVRGTVAAEPDLREGLQLLTVEVTATSLDGGRSWQQAIGRVEASASSLDDWSAPG